MNNDRAMDKSYQSGIYELDCECGAKYTGKTTRKFSQRFNEHKHSFIHIYPERSNYAPTFLIPDTHSISITSKF